MFYVSYSTKLKFQSNEVEFKLVLSSITNLRKIFASGQEPFKIIRDMNILIETVFDSIESIYNKPYHPFLKLVRNEI